MPTKRRKIKLSSTPMTGVSRTYITVYLLFLLAEMVYIFLAWSPYGSTDGAFRSWYMFVRKNLATVTVLWIVLLVFFSMIFPGIGAFALIITLYRVAELCCGKTQKESFGDGLPYGWGTYNPDNATRFDQGQLGREQDYSRAGYSSAEGDNNDSYWLSLLANREENLVAIYPKSNCSDGEWIVPKLEVMTHKRRKNMSDYCGCQPCSMSLYGALYESYLKPRPLYTTSLLAKEMDLS